MTSIADQIKDPNALRRNIVPWSIYIMGARDMLCKLRGHGYIDEARPKGDIPHSKGDGLVINKAVIDMLLDNKVNIDRFLMEQYEIHIKDHEKDKKGRLTKCKAYFARKVEKWEEV